MKKQGEEFLRRIEELKQNLQLEGRSLQVLQREISEEKRNLLQSEKQTPSQKRISEKIKRSLERKKEKEIQPKVRNYNIKDSTGAQGKQSQWDLKRGVDLTGRDDHIADTEPMNSRAGHNDYADDENHPIINLPVRAKTGVGSQSDLRRKNSEGILLRKTPTKKVGNEIII